MANLEKVQVTLNIYEACRTNTGRARKSDGHYSLPLLAQISGARFEDCLADLQWCAEHKEDSLAIETIIHLANALLSAYQIQTETYK